MTFPTEPNTWPLVLDTTDPRWNSFQLEKPQLTQRPFRPNGATLLCTSAEIESALRQQRSIVYITVGGWSVQERLSRDVFAAFVDQCTKECVPLDISFFVLSEYTEGSAELFNKLDLPNSAGTGYGAVVWIENGHVVHFVSYAREAGVNGLIDRTLQCWGAA